MAIEKPTYDVLSSKNGIEIRHYDEYWVAECLVTGESDLSDASSRAFGRLFNYISGENSAGKFAALQYSGSWNSKKFEEKSRELINGLGELGLATDGTVQSAVYNPPFLPPFLRRNEVLVRLKA